MSEKKKSFSEKIQENNEKLKEAGKNLSPDDRRRNQKKNFGCLIILLIIVFGITSILISPAKTTPLEKLFKDNDLGLVENIKESTWTNGKILDFETRKIKYKAFLKEDGSIYQLFVGKGKAFPIYDESNNDTIIDNDEKKIIARMEKFFNKEISLNGSVKYLVEDLKKQLSFPDTFKHVESVYFDMGKYYIINIKFNSKNAFGMSIPAVAKYKIDFEKNTYSLIDIIQ